LASSHPIYVEVKSPAEVTSSSLIHRQINQIFDAISYSKGASLIRMLNAFLGQEVFMNGVRDYLKKFKYENAKTNDLWDYLSKASGKDVSSLMKSWIGKMGYPLVSVSAEEYDTVKKEQVLHLQQKRFLASESLLTEKKPEETIWWIPLNIVTSDSNVSLPIILSEPAGTIRFSYTSGAESFWKLNYNATGFYRVQRDEKKLADLSHLMSKHRAKFSTPDRISLVADAFELGKSGHGSTVGALEVLRNFSSEDNYK
jgi:aminopeptidase 2